MVQFICVSIFSVVILAGSSLRALAEDRPPEVERWLPAIGLSIGLEIYDISASSITNGLNAPFRSTEESPLRPASNGDIRVTASTVDTDFSLMAPAFLSLPGKPRFFVHGNIQLNLAADTVPTSEGARGSIRVPRDGTGTPVSLFDAAGILGQGTKTQIKYDRIQYRAGAGVAFTIDTQDRRFRIKPSIEYTRREIEVLGGATRVVQLPGTPPSITVLDETTVRVETIDLKRKRTLHGVGPGLEVEFDVRRTGPTILTLFAGASAYYFIGDLEDDLVGISSVDETLRLHFEYDRWTYRANIGFRFRWQPE